MGAWATDVFGNDTGLDFLSSLISEDAVKKVLKRAGKKPDMCAYDEIRIAAAILIHLHKLNDMWFEQETIGKMIDLLDVASKDQDWVDSWVDERDGKEVRKQVKSLAKKLRELEGY